MTTIILLCALLYVWAAAVFIMAEIDDASYYWGPFEWTMHIAFPVVLPVAILVELLDGPTRRAIKKAKAIYRDAIDWLQGKYPL